MVTGVLAGGMSRYSAVYLGKFVKVNNEAYHHPVLCVCMESIMTCIGCKVTEENFSSIDKGSGMAISNCLLSMRLDDKSKACMASPFLKPLYEISFPASLPMRLSTPLE